MTIKLDDKGISKPNYKVIGTRPIRHDGLEKVTGQARYSADINLPGMLYGKVLRSPHAHARIRDIDAGKALALKGVFAVITSADFSIQSDKVVDLGEGAMTNPGFLSQNVMAKEKVLYKGHAVAAVAAESLHLADEALALIDVDYEVMTPVFDVREAMKPGAPLLHDRLYHSSTPFMRPGGLKDDDDGSPGSNIASHFVFELGNPENAFSAADILVEREFQTKPVHQGYIEPHAATATWNRDGKATLWCSSQGQFTMRDQSAALLGIPASNIRVIPLEIGGGFGGKTLVYLEPIALLLAKKAGRSVKVTMSRKEVFEGTGPTSGSFMRVKIGANNDGKFVAAEGVLAYEAGAFPGSPVNPGAQCMFASYDLKDVRVEGYDVVVNKQKVAAYRAPGSPGSCFAVETVIDELAEKLNIDPLEIRRKNGAKEGTRRVSGPVFGKIGYLETIETAKAHPHYLEPIGNSLDGKLRGRGVASGFWFNGSGPACATANVNSDGTVSLMEGSPDIGGTRAMAAMSVAEVLGLSALDVHPLVGDTDSIGYTSNTGGSSVAFKTGWACYEAAQDIKRQCIDRAAEIWGVDPGQVEMHEGVLNEKSGARRQFTFKELASVLLSTGGPVVGKATVDPTGVGGAFALHIADVEVDPQTGKVDVIRYTAFQDVGRAIHPSYVEGQIQGGAAQGIGWALHEEYVFSEDGTMLNSSFLDYRMPTSLDLPMIEAVIVEVPNPGHPFGVRGVGEVPIVPPMAAIANAVYDAIGVRISRLPINPSTVLEAIWAKEGSGQG